MRPIISFLSDFGLLDPYVAAVKGVILARARDATVVDVTHDVPPQAVAEAVFLAEQAWPYFPPGTVHLAVVDPGVGTERRGVALRTPAGYAIGPDNGVLSAAFPAEVREQVAAHSTQMLGSAATVELPRDFEAREILSAHVIRRSPSVTFHGRDVFGPAAAFLASGGEFDTLGPALRRVMALPPVRGRPVDGAILGEVVHVDRFGNLISSIRSEQLVPGTARVEIQGRQVPVVRTYGEGRDLVALVGSAGCLEVAYVNGSAARELGCGAGTLVSVVVV
jgi:S-adenosylmethionine hydrolase